MIHDEGIHINISSRVIFIISLFTIVTCYPVPMSANDDASKGDAREEIRCANGTLIGKYAYTDDQGNPIQVKYFADDSSYGVELNSIKVSNTEDQNIQKASNNANPEPILTENAVKNAIKNAGTKREDEGFHVFHRDAKPYKKLEEYEVYHQTDMSPSKTCHREKIRVYNSFNNEKPKRKSREARHDPKALDRYEAPQFCEPI